jgi:integrase
MAKRVFRPKRPRTRDAGIAAAPDGSYRIDVRLVRADGTVFRRQGSAKSKAEARKKRDQSYEEFNILEGGSQYADTMVVLKDGPTLAEWTETCANQHWRRTASKSWKDYEQSMRDHVLPILGSIPVSQLKPSHIRNALYQIGEKKVAGRGSAEPALLSVSSLKAAKTALSAALRAAVESGYLEVNPARSLGMQWRPMETRRQAGREAEDGGETVGKRLLTRDELGRALEAAKGTGAYPLLLLQGNLGLRIGEALGLKKSDFDLERGVVEIRRQLQRVDLPDGGTELRPTSLKTEKSRRTIPVPKSVAAYVSGLGEGPIAANGMGGWMDPRNAHRVLRRAFESAGLCGQPGLPDPSSHDLRFSWISYLLNDCKVPVTVVSRLAGHSDIGTTLRYYSEASEENLVQAMSHFR